MDAAFIASYAPRAADSDFYICGPAALVETVRQAAADLGVPKNRFHDEDFAFHPVSKEKS
jgi:ferredoxin-NADP reductase